MPEPLPVSPPAMRTLPFFRSVAVASERAVCMLPVATNLSGGTGVGVGVGLGVGVAVAVGVGVAVGTTVPVAEGVAIGVALSISDGVGLRAQPDPARARNAARPVIAAWNAVA